MELYIYNRGMDLVAISDRFSSLRWRRKFFEPGEFELHLPATLTNIATYQKGNILCRTDRKEAGIVESVVIADAFTVKGRMLSCILADAILSRTYNFNGTVEQAMRTVVSQEAGRIHGDIVLGTLNGYPETLESQVSYKNALDTVKKLSKSFNIGFGLSPDIPAKSLVFYTYTGVDRNARQTQNPRVIFNDEFQNLLNPTCTQDIAEYKNFAYVGGEGEGNDRIIVTVDRTNGNRKRELWVDAKDLRKDNGMTDAAYLSLLVQRGNEKLDGCPIVSSFEGTGVNVQNFEYLTDWDLGDIVTVGQDKWGISDDKRITEVEETYENGIAKVIPVFGTPLPETLNLEE